MELIAAPKGDPFDPNNWIKDDHEHRIYADETLELYAVVDWIDYIELCKYRWSVHTKNYGRYKRPQVYLRRSVNEEIGSARRYECFITGKILENRQRIVRTLFLHQAVMQRMRILPPSPDHNIINHRDRNSMNCRRSNLFWATHLENSHNRSRNGRAWKSTDN